MRNFRFPAGLTALTLALGCSSGSTGPADKTVASIVLTPATIDTIFSFGATVEIAASARNQAGDPISGVIITFQSSQIGVATVNQSGEVTAVANGATEITATSGGVSATVTVRVRQKLARALVKPDTAGISVGRTVALSATGEDQRGNAFSGTTTPSFVSGNTGVATVSSSGVVTAIGPGTATITASLTSPIDGTKSANAVITVTPPPPASVTVGMTQGSFVPPAVVVAVGGTVTWVNTSGVEHDVDFGTPAMRIPDWLTGQRSLTFPTAGRFAYHCNLHSGMNGTVTVQ